MADWSLLGLGGGLGGLPRAALGSLGADGGSSPASPAAPGDWMERAKSAAPWVLGGVLVFSMFIVVAGAIGRER